MKSMLAILISLAAMTGCSSVDTAPKTAPNYWRVTKIEPNYWGETKIHQYTSDGHQREIRIEPNWFGTQVIKEIEY